jgi:hypothetical protein
MKPLERATFNKEGLDKISENYLQDNNLEEVWINDLYQVNVRRNIPCEGIKDDNGNPVLMTHLSIKNKDRSANVDWRNFQYIKNQLVGDECEGAELFPAESRLIDGANQWHIFCFQNPEIRFPFGFFHGRMVTEKTFIKNVVQRPFPDERKPIDLKECEDKFQNILNQYNKDTNN